MPRDVILDTSAVIRLDGKKTATLLTSFLREHLPGTHFRLKVSVFTCYEFTRTAKNFNEAQRKAEFIRQWDYVDADRVVMKVATMYYNLLSQLRKLDDQRLMFPHIKTQLSDADVIIGATALQHDLLIVTLDGNDFPRPFFKEWHVSKVGDDMMYILQPDIDFFQQAVVDLYKELPA